MSVAGQANGQSGDSILLLQAALVTACVLPFSLFAYTSWVERQKLEDFADNHIARSTDVVNEHALKVFETVERAIAEINEIVRPLTDHEIVERGAELHARLQRIAQTSTQIKSLWIFAANGRAPETTHGAALVLPLRWSGIRSCGKLSCSNLLGGSETSDHQIAHQMPNRACDLIQRHLFAIHP